MTAVFFSNRRGFNLGEKKLPVFSDTVEVQEGFSATGGHFFGSRGPTRLHAFDFFASTQIQ
ncbi:hypothetical protein EVC45_00190 [Paraburkholderia sp. UYCP14C]|uniref:hypothetical protein n=1 Tax=Paraburkholderia sp. UYCP14C TaxID=2511130 RepID=UPI00101E8B59|nr:hypothetical protein [Paraburkholderia sp. UYCP14C]RZF31520.1 hypothetical protein EVC45_00190 [Paraburkholderia sp. UYCP14C]